MQIWPRKFKLKLATLTWKLTERKKNDFCIESAQFNLSNCQNVSAHHQKKILRIPKHPQLAKFAQNLAEKQSKQSGTLQIQIQYQINFGKQ